MSEPIGRPFVNEEKAGRYAWCTCGESEKRPFCDGSHARKGTGKTPLVTQLEEDKRVAWCNCLKTGTPPFCDGSHSK